MFKCYQALFQALPSVKIWCIGDIMLDTFTFGKVARISPEAPVPVLKVGNVRNVLGGAGNVVRNLTELGVNVSCMGVIGDDTAGHQVHQLLSQIPQVTPYLYRDHPDRMTVHKTRFIDHQQLLRVDVEAFLPVIFQKEMQEALSCGLKQAQAVILSDYAKGMLSSSMTKFIIERCRLSQVPVFIDPKGQDWNRYHGATLLTPNHKEMETYASCALSSKENLVEAALEAIEKLALQGILITKGDQGMTLVRPNHPPLTERSKALEVYDVSGAGDTVISALAAFYAAGAPLEQAAYIANVAAGIVVGKMGTAAISLNDLSQVLGHGPHGYKVVTLEKAQNHLKELHPANLTIGFTNGCFDVLHQGHLSLLAQAKEACDYLIVAVNSDSSIKRLKGNHRPIQDQETRASVLAALKMVDCVVIFDEDTPIHLIEKLCPNVLIKGADYQESQVVGADFVKNRGGRVLLASLTPGHSTSQTLEKIKAHLPHP